MGYFVIFQVLHDMYMIMQFLVGLDIQQENWSECVSNLEISTLNFFCNIVI
jgi:hypothetical protein